MSILGSLFAFRWLRRRAAAQPNVDDDTADWEEGSAPTYPAPGATAADLATDRLIEGVGDTSPEGILRQRATLARTEH